MTPLRAFALAALLPVLAGCDSDGRPTEVHGRGSTFVEPVMKFWTTEYEERTGGAVRINYTGAGSGNGVSSLTEKLADFGCTDAPMTRKQLELATAVGGPVVHVPLVIGAVVPVYNLPGVDRPVVFSGPILADLFTGKIGRWNAPRLRELNPGVDLPDLAVLPVYRADPSGTTFLFTDYLSKASPAFRATVGASNDPRWPERIGTKQPKSDGVAGQVQRTPGAVGYVELTYALDAKIPYGAVVNRSGKPVSADFDSIAAAADAAIGPTAHDLTYSLTDATGEKSYPIAGMAYAVLFRKQSGAKGAALVDFLRWAISAAGQELARERNYAPLPGPLQERIRQELDTVTIE